MKVQLTYLDEPCNIQAVGADTNLRHAQWTVGSPLGRWVAPQVHNRHRFRCVHATFGSIRAAIDLG